MTASSQARLRLAALLFVVVFTGAKAAWVQLLDNKAYGGTWDMAYPTLAAGEFTRIKAVHRSGYITCDRAYSVDGNPWQECNTGTTVTRSSFQLAKNGALVLTQPNWHTLPPQCTLPSTPAGDIECDVNLALASGDTLTPTWLEAWEQDSLHDNDGTHYIDLYGWADAPPWSTPEFPACDHGSAGPRCTCTVSGAAATTDIGVLVAWEAGNQRFAVQLTNTNAAHRHVQAVMLGDNRCKVLYNADFSCSAASTCPCTAYVPWSTFADACIEDANLHAGPGDRVFIVPLFVQYRQSGSSSFASHTTYQRVQYARVQ